jgi:UPF0176 protein
MAILNLAGYLFTPLADPQAVATDLRAWPELQAVRGTILLAEEGINAFLAGPPEAIQAVEHRLAATAPFAALTWKRSWSQRVPFQRLLIKVKAEIVSFRRTTKSPYLERAPAVQPAQLKAWLDQGHDDQGRPIALLDTRNACELEYGSFIGAELLPIDKFSALPDATEALRHKLSGHFCTGGIRCEKAAPYLADAGFANVLQLEGGILNYFEKVGAAHYAGSCFVFDERVALNPALEPLVDS